MIKLQDLYTRFVGFPDVIRQVEWKEVLAMISLTDIDKNDFVLDLGCGTGTFISFYLMKIANKMCGVDISFDYVKKAKNRKESAAESMEIEYVGDKY